ncbi:MAG: hypothetical protein PHC34_05110 [Candidatus Gastranaerophilales bacterium]|nr:hypothetical protein [Candidatus Gastranaerophilales bacterium]
MAVGARDNIDRRLVQMYSKVQTNNFELASAIDPSKMMNSMELMALNNKSYFEIKNNIGQRKSDLRDIA